eukprot:gene11113-14915_t
MMKGKTSASDSKDSSVHMGVSSKSFSTDENEGSIHLASPKGQKQQEFVNVGLQNWQRIRNEWTQLGNNNEVANSKSPLKSNTSRGEVKAKSIDTEEVIEKIFSQSKNDTLSTPVPLGQMIDILIDFWEADGLYD